MAAASRMRLLGANLLAARRMCLLGALLRARRRGKDGRGLAVPWA